MASIKGIICKLFGHKLVICSNKKINDITYLQEVKCTICGKTYKRYSYDKNVQYVAKYIRDIVMIKNDEDLNITEEEWQEFLEFMEKYEKSKENSILFIIYNKIKNLKKGKE